MSYNEIIIPNLPELSLSVKKLIITPEKRHTRGMHFHKEFEIFRVDEGEFSFTVGDVCEKLTDGDVLLIGSFFPHTLRPLSPYARATYFQIDLQTYLNTLLNPQDQFLHFFMHHNHAVKFKLFQNDPKMAPLVDAIERELESRDEFFEMQIKVYMYQFLVYLFQFGFWIKSPLESKGIAKLLPSIRYIDANFEKKISLAELSALLHVDKYYFCKLFKQATGATAVDYIHFVRMHHAEQQLRQSDKAVSQIALDCGFASMQYFNKLFKKHHGFTPVEYKKMFLSP